LTVQQPAATPAIKEATMLGRGWFGLIAAGVLAAGCASVFSEPSAEAKSALTPTGKLRVGFLTAPIYATKDSASGYRGVAPDLGKELSKRLGVPFEPVAYGGVPALQAGAKSGEWDVAFMGINAERATLVDFSTPFMEVEQGLLARAGVSVVSIADIDREGMRIGVLEKSGADGYLSQRTKKAQIARATTADQLFGLISAGNVDVVAGTKARLFDDAAKLSGSRVLDGRILVEPIGMAVPKGRNVAAAKYVDQFVAEAKAEGLVKQAIETSKLRGVVVAPGQ
jgi:polar amino acid transport system substrate-binding protein